MSRVARSRESRRPCSWTLIATAFVAVLGSGLLLLGPDMSAQAQPPQPALPQFVPGEVIVRFRPAVAPAARGNVRRFVGALRLRFIGRLDDRLELLRTSIPVEQAIAALERLPDIEFAEPNWIAQHAATSDDPYYTNGTLWGMYGDRTTPHQNMFGSQAGELWERGFTGSNATLVGVVDEGVDISHPDLTPNIWINPFDPLDGFDNDGNGYIDDIHGWDFVHDDNTVFDAADGDAHGTHVAGTIGARGGNSIGVAGVNWNVTLISTKFLAANGMGSYADAAAAMDYITDLKTRHGLNIVATNNSWGGPAYSVLLHEAVIRSAKGEILVIAAAGNNSRNNDATPHYPSSYATNVAAGSESPASYDAVIAVASITSSGARSSFSNYGATSVDIGAPGSAIMSTIPSGYGFLSGTSMATPHVTGATAIFKSMNTGASPQQIRDAILTQGIPTDSLAGITVTGRRLNVGDFAASAFTDHPLIPGVTVIKAVHILELRESINAARASRGLSPFAFSDLGAGSIIRALHIIELRSALPTECALPAYTDPVLVPGVTPVRAIHITELRSAVLACP